MTTEISLEEFWNMILSRDKENIRRAYAALNEEGKDAVRKHLLRMAREEGWHPEQRRSARAALRVLDIHYNNASNPD